MSNRDLRNLLEQIAELKLSQDELRSENSELRNRVRALESNQSAQAVQSQIWPRRGERVKINIPTLPRNYHRQHIIEADRFGTVDYIRSPWVYLTTDSGIQHYRYPENLIIIKNDEKNNK